MRHKELLAKIDELNNSCSVADELATALRSVVELHTPRSSGPFEFCFECNGWTEDDGTEYPCPTIEAIIGELVD